MTNKIQRLSVLLVVVMLIFVFASACNSGNKPASTESGSALSQTSGSDTGGKTLEPVTIVYQSWSPTKETMDTILEGFKKVRPEITVEVKLHANFTDYLTALKTAAAIGESPDVFQFDSPQSLMQMKSLIEPLNSFAQKDWGGNWKDKFVAGPLGDCTIGDDVLGLPVPIMPAGVIWYNKTILDENGIAEPKTYEDLKAAAIKLNDKKIAPMFLGNKDSWSVIDHFQTILNDVAPGKQYQAYAKEIKFTDPDIVKAFDVWKKFFDDKIFQADSFSMTQYMDSYNAFLIDQRGAMWSNGAWNLDLYSNKDIEKEVGSVEWGVMSMPDLNGDGKFAPLLSTANGTCMSNSSKNKEAAWELVKYFGYGDGVVVYLNTWLGANVLTEAREITVEISENARKNREAIGELVSSLGTVKRGIDDAKVTEVLYEVLTKVAYGRMTGQEAAEAVQKAIDAN